MATITTRRLDPVTWEPQWGNGQADFLSDIDAVAQIIKQRLLLFQGEWWADQGAGLPAWQQILGSPGGANPDQVALLIQQQILAAPYVTGISNVQVNFVHATRTFGYYAEVQTQFGPVAVTSYPQPPAQGVPA